jgi:F-type H+-transporting ATPase subunit alpha
MEKIQDAEKALLENNHQFPEDILKRIFSDKEMSSPDREAILKIAGNIVASFQDKPAPDQTKK